MHRWYFHMLLHRFDKANYENAYESTIDAFVQLRTWADRARVVIKSSISDAMHTLPCKNGQAIENQKNNWNAKFLSTNVYPIDSYMDRLAELNNAFTGDLFSYLRCYKDKGGALWDRAMVHMKNGVTTTIECWDLCMRNGYSLFGLQYPPGGECFCSNDKDEATQFGESNNCDGRRRGGNWALDIYQMPYAFVSDKTCEAYGMASIHDPDVCKDAASQLAGTNGIREDYRFSDVVGWTNPGRPNGCSYHRFGNVEQWHHGYHEVCTVNGYAGCFCKVVNGDIKTGILIGNVELHFGVKYAIKSVSSGK